MDTLPLINNMWKRASTHRCAAVLATLSALLAMTAPLTSSEIDVWTNRVSPLVVDDWYMTDSHHQGIWFNDSLHVSRNFVRFELEYQPWQVGPGAGGIKVAETKRVTLDAEENLDRFESSFKIEGKAPSYLPIGISIARHQGGVVRFEKNAGWLRSWEPRGKVGNLGCAIIAPPVAVVDYERTDSDQPPQHWSARVCDAIMRRSPVLTERWTYDAGVVLKGFEQVWRATGDRRYFDYIKSTIDRLIDGDGGIRGYNVEDYNLDDINLGKLLFPLLAQAGNARDRERYRRALHTLRAQLQAQPRTSDGGFWHKKIYPSQMWLDGLYMAAPFLAQYAAVFHEPALFDQAAGQILLGEKHLRDATTGLLYHGWDESRAQRWANPRTGTSANFWARGMGWYAMALVDVLEQLPKDHPRRRAVLGALRRLAVAVASVQSRTTGVWWQVLDAPDRAKNYPEASASSMFVYALSKGVRSGWLDRARFAPVASRGYQGILDQFVQVDERGQVTLTGVCKVAGLGGAPYRDGTYEYYTSTDIVANDPKGLGAFILASVEQRAGALH